MNNNLSSIITKNEAKLGLLDVSKNHHLSYRKTNNLVFVLTCLFSFNVKICVNIFGIPCARSFRL